jgi:tRNA pseudouridine38-40 synthase
VTLFDDDTGPGPARCKLVVAYDGTNFRGYAIQPDVRTVEGVLTKALEKLRHWPLDNLSCAGRTDAGVHAWGQVVSFDATPGLDPWRLQAALNKMLGPEVVVRSADLVEADFDARRSARSRTYTYAIVNRPVPDPFLARFAWWVPEPLDLATLRMAADPFVGEHDFSAFCRTGPEGSTTVRRVLASHWAAAEDGVLRYEITAAAFCWQMVRSIVGTLVDVGKGKRRPGELMAILRSRDRARAGAPAPPHGLCLWEVGY